MRTVGLIVVVPLLASCEFIPGTSSHSQAKAKQAAAAELIDPSSAQFRNIASRDGIVCGEINGKNRMGAYVGFTRFYVLTDDWQASLDPQFDPGLLLSSRRLCASPYGSSSCETVAEEEAKQIMQQLFNDTWARRCALPMNSSSAPFDPTRGSNVGAPSMLDNSLSDRAFSTEPDALSGDNVLTEPSSNYDAEIEDAPPEVPAPPVRAEEPSANVSAGSNQRETLDQEWLDRAINRPPPAKPAATPPARNQDRPD